MMNEKEVKFVQDATDMLEKLSKFGYGAIPGEVAKLIQEGNEILEESTVVFPNSR